MTTHKVGAGTSAPAVVYSGLEPRGTPNLNTGQDDAEVLARVRGGDRDAYAELVRRHAPVAVRTAALLGAGGDAEDVVQEAFVKAYGALDRFRPGAPFRPWLLRIVANETRNLHRVSRPPHGAGAALVGADRAAAPRPAGRPGRGRALARAAAGAGPRAWRGCRQPHRQVVTCRYLLDLDEAETAAVLGWPRGTVKSRLHRALGKLRDQLETEHETEVTHGG